MKIPGNLVVVKDIKTFEKLNIVENYSVSLEFILQLTILSKHSIYIFLGNG